MFQVISSVMGTEAQWKNVLEKSLIGRYIPFRSPRIKDLPRKPESLVFARRLWSEVLTLAAPKLVICLGRDVQRELQKMLPLSIGLEPLHSQIFETGWGNYKAELYKFVSENQTIHLLYLPHLSTYKLFTTDKCQHNVREILRAATSHLR